jgi:hypothetical protein
MNNKEYLNIKEISLKYNCHPDTVRYFAKKNNVPYIIVNKNKIYHFFPKFEYLFSTRRSLNKENYNTNNIYFIQHFLDKKPLVLIFKNYNDDFKYINKNGAFCKRFLTNSTYFNRYLKSINKNEFKLIKEFINIPDFSGNLLIWKMNKNSDPFIFDYKIFKNYPMLVKLFLCNNNNCIKLTSTEKNFNETYNDFCLRLHKEDSGVDQISLSELKNQLGLTINRNYK